jgi:integral membrane sensor domain MASE1
VSNGTGLPPATPRQPPGRFWPAAAGTAVLAATVMLSLHHNAQFIAAGLLATATAIAALAEAGFRSRTGRPSFIFDSLTAALALAAALTCLLALAAGHPPR